MVGLRQVLASCTRVGAKGGAVQMPWKTVDRGHDIDERVPNDHNVVPRHFSDVGTQEPPPERREAGPRPLETKKPLPGRGYGKVERREGVEGTWP